MPKSDNMDKSVYREDVIGGLPSHSSDRRINKNGRVIAMAINQVQQKVKEDELNKREQDLQIETMKSLMAVQESKAQADQATSELMNIAKGLAFQQAQLDGKMQAQQSPMPDQQSPMPAPMDTGMAPQDAGLPMLPPDMGGPPALSQIPVDPNAQGAGGGLPQLQPGPVPVEPSMAPPM